MIEITECAIASGIDAVWHGYVRSRFVGKAAEIVNDESVRTLYAKIRSDRKIRPDSRKAEFVSRLSRGEFVGTVAFHAIRMHNGD